MVSRFLSAFQLLIPRAESLRTVRVGRLEGSESKVTAQGDEASALLLDSGCLGQGLARTVLVQYAL
jgi:hypothetical protein